MVLLGVTNTQTPPLACATNEGMESLSEDSNRGHRYLAYGPDG